MAERLEYVVDMGGMVYTVLLSQADAERHGDRAKLKMAPVKNKQVAPSNK